MKCRPIDHSEHVHETMRHASNLFFLVCRRIAFYIYKSKKLKLSYWKQASWTSSVLLAPFLCNGPKRSPIARPSLGSLIGSSHTRRIERLREVSIGFGVSFSEPASRAISAVAAASRLSPALDPRDHRDVGGVQEENHPDAP